MLEKTLEDPLDYKEIKLVNPKENQSQIFIGRTNAEAETPILWPPYAKNRLIGKKTLMLGKFEGRRRRGWQRMRWMASLTQWTWLWASSGSWLRTGKPGMLQSMGSQSQTWLSDCTELAPSALSGHLVNLPYTPCFTSWSNMLVIFCFQLIKL